MGLFVEVFAQRQFLATQVERFPWIETRGAPIGFEFREAFLERGSFVGRGAGLYGMAGNRRGILFGAGGELRVFDKGGAD